MPSPPSTSDLLQLSQAVRGTFKRRRAASAGPLSVLPAASVAVSAPLVAVCAAARSTTLLCSAVVRYLRFGGSAIGDERIMNTSVLAEHASYASAAFNLLYFVLRYRSVSCFFLCNLCSEVCVGLCAGWQHHMR